MTTIEHPTLLTAPEVAKRLGVGRNLAYRLIATGDIPGVVRVGRAVRLPEAAYEAFVARGGTLPNDDE